MQKFWQDHKERLRAYVGKRVRESDAIDDILQNVYLKAHTSLHTLKSEGSVTSWLYRITANAITDYYRSQRPTEELPADLAAPEAERNMFAELAECLRPLIGTLPPTYQSALVLSELEGLPQKEVANRLGISLSGVKSRILRGREKLRERLLECCEVECEGGRIADFKRRGGGSGSCGGECG